MNVKRFLGLALFTYLLCAAFAVGTETETPPDTTPRTVVTVTLGDLTQQQLQDRAKELTTTTSTSTTTSTQPVTTVVAVPSETHCQELFPIAIEVGWPNDPAVLIKLGQLLFKETRCQNIVAGDPRFNGHDWGPAQINEPSHRAWVEQIFNMPFEQAMADPTLNLRFAFMLYNSIEETGACGWRPWSLC
jgi:hypothetical protein